jgi:protein-disulfide isomerase
VGLAASLYLIHLDLKVAYGSGDDVCSAVFGTGCEGALMSDWGSVGGMPLAAWGILYFCLLGALGVLGWALGGQFQRETAGAAFFVSLAGLAGSLVLAAELLFGDTPFCPFCMVVHGVNLLLPWMLAAAAGSTASALLRRPASAFADDEEAVPRQWKALGHFAALLLCVIAYQQLGNQVNHGSTEGSTQELRLTVAEFDAEEQHSIAVGPDDALLGRPDAPVKMVIFSDFQCPACRNFAIWSKQLKEELGDDVAFVFKHFPLSTNCNPIMKQDMHPLACPAALGAEAARQQGKFWEYHDAIFEVGLQNPNQLAQIVQKIGLDPAQVNQLLATQEPAQHLKRDIDLGVQLKIDSTPAVFWNGRRVRRISLPLAKLLLERNVTGG